MTAIPNELLDKALEQIGKGAATYEYFFAQLQTPTWIGPLLEKGFFKSPPSLMRLERTVSIPSWPESQYLARVTSQSPEQVQKILLALPDTDNIRVHEDVVTAALAMPAPMAAAIGAREARWLKAQRQKLLFMPEALGRLISHLATGGQTKSAFDLARALLRIGRKDGEEDPTLVGRYEYGRLLEEHIPALRKADGLRTLGLLCDCLMHAAGGDRNDYSYIWRPAIEEHSQNQKYSEIRDALVDAVRDSAQALIEEGIVEPTLVLHDLQKRPGGIFRRLGLNLLANNIIKLAEQAEQSLFSPTNFDDSAVHHEYILLMRALLPLLQSVERERFFLLLQSGPVTEKLDDDPALRSEQIVHWQARLLAALGTVVPTEWLKRLPDAARLTATFEHPDFLTYSSSWTGPTSPKTADNLNAMDVPAIARYLETWKPDGKWNAPTPEGLARALQQSVVTEPQRFVDRMELFRLVHPTYVRAVFQGLREAVEAGRTFDWVPVLKYLKAAQPSTPISRATEAGLDADPHWGWARRSIASLLQLGFEKDSIPESGRTLAWDVLHPLTEDPDPSAESEADTGMDPVTRSINTPRGEAMHAVIQYALWLHRLRTKGDQLAEYMPEVWAILDRHLDSSVERTLTIRTVYGRWFPWLLLMNPAWATKNRDVIFPTDEKCDDIRRAAWEAYIVFSRPYDNVYPVLRAQYGWAVSNLFTATVAGRDVASPNEHVGQHLAVYLSRGFEQAAELMRTYLLNGGDLLAAHVMAFIGRSFKSDKGELPRETQERLEALWDWLFEAAKLNPKQWQKTLKAFGAWAASDSFKFEWRAQNLIAARDLAGATDDDYDVVEALKAHAASHPKLALDVLAAVVRSDRNGWGRHMWKDDAREVIRIVLAKPETAEAARILLNELGARGYLDFRDLMPAIPG